MAFAIQNPCFIQARFAVLAAALAVLLGCSGGTRTEAGEDPPVPAGPNVVIQWNQAALQAIRDTKPGPPMTARALAVVHTCIYDAWAAYDPRAVGTTWGDELRRPTAEASEGRKAKAVSYAAYRALVDLYPSEKPKFDALMGRLGYDPGDTGTGKATPQGIGNLAAAAVLALRHVDGANQLGDLAPGAYADYTGYRAINPAASVTAPTPISGIPAPGRWQPLTFVNAAGQTVTPAFIAPHWGLVRPFALTRADQFRPPAPEPWDSPAFRVQVEEVIALQANLTDAQKCIAEYWADGPSSELPPGHFNLFAQHISARDRHGLDQDVKLFFALTKAIFDAGIATWEAKRAYDYWRPVTAIRFLFSGTQIPCWRGPGLGVGPMDGSNWKPYQPDWFPTPPFPEHTSGHSGFSAAGAEVLLRFTGSDRFEHSVTIPARSLKAEPQSPATSVTLSWPTFSAAADQAGLSRLYGGIHFRDGDLQGRTLGRRAGVQAYEKARAFWEGRARPLAASQPWFFSTVRNDSLPDPGGSANREAITGQ